VPFRRHHQLVTPDRGSGPRCRGSCPPQAWRRWTNPCLPASSSEAKTSGS